MNREAMFPDAHTEGLEARVAQAWDLDWPLPVPKFDMTCPRCAFPPAPLVLKDWRFHARSSSGSKKPWRCDVRLKCVDCSIVLTFGVALTRAAYEAATGKGLIRGGRWIEWREGKHVLAEAGFFER